MRAVGLTLAALVLLATPAALHAGPPFLTDDPVPTDAGHWEIYGPALELAGKGAAFDGSAELELNYGAAPDLQLTMSLPLALAHDSAGLRARRGYMELAAKYRFFHDEAHGISIAAFPALTLPTAAGGMGNRRVTALLPVWGQKDLGAWSVFGGGGFAINPGAGNRNYWTGGMAVSRPVTRRLTLGVEADRQGADAVDGRAATSLGLGAIWEVRQPFRLLASGGPTFTDGKRSAGFHIYAAIGLAF